ncbi:hypothetical protein [Polyangium jinanense]|uniref:Uncharacterized protein n=1 Tax=Polyangium jinanense TaxID=2829994 RepID=A0A9X3X8P2_9BACT|nr:hypothetical protein [Polyangium jinanense]MDC3985799.1 hypothetical protein [Polyangium jinanense]
MVTSADYSGYLLFFDESEFRRKALSDLDEPGHIATISTVADDWPHRGVELCFISTDGVTISHVALARKGDMIVTREYRVTLYRISAIDPAGLMHGDSQHLCKWSLHVCTRAPIEVWNRIYAQASSSQIVIELNDRRIESNRRYRDDAYTTMAMERDAIGISLEISGFDRSLVLVEHELSGREPSSYIKRLRGASSGLVHEDRMIEHDAQLFQGAIGHKTDVIGTVVFSKSSGERLYVTNYNRTPVESTLGVDLVYYNELYRSFVMVQYKRMQQESGDHVFRFSKDKNYEDEFAKMYKFDIDALQAIPTNALEYRLHPGAFFFKLCPDAFFDPISPDMINGMYFPVSYWHVIGGTDETMGPKGGRRVSYDNSGRYFSNGLFAQLVRFGWIGSTNVATSLLEDVIDSSLKNGRSVTLASGRATREASNKRVKPDSLRPKPSSGRRGSRNR